MLKYIFLGFLSIMLIAVSPGCKKSCGVNCLHGGTCEGNTCSCPDPYSGYNCDTLCTLGYEGYMCSTLSREKFLGTWSCKATDQSGNSKTYLVTFTANGYDLFMNLNNFNNAGGYPIICTLTGKTQFSIDQTQQHSIDSINGVSGSGNLQNGKIVLNISENNNVTFFATLTQQ